MWSQTVSRRSAWGQETGPARCRAIRTCQSAMIRSGMRPACSCAAAVAGSGAVATEIEQSFFSGQEAFGITHTPCKLCGHAQAVAKAK